MKIVRRNEVRIVQMEMLLAGSKDRRCVDVTLAQFAKRKYGFSFDEKTGSPEQFYEAIKCFPSNTIQDSRIVFIEQI
jgi:hypothetical protein